MKRPYALVFVLSCLLVAQLDAAGSIYVDPVGGQDGNSGRDRSAPFQTLTKAQAAVRAQLAANVGDVTVYLRGGIYPLTATLVFTPADCSGPGHHVTYRAYGGERPVLSGGRRITGWTLHDPVKNIWQAPTGGPIETRQLYVNGRRAVRARSAGGLPGATLVTATSTTSDYRDDHDVVYVGYRTTAAGMARWCNPGDIELVFRKLWTAPRAPVATITADGSQALITMKQPAFFWVNNKGMTSPRGAPIYVENAYELLDEEGEFYLDRSAGLIFYKPLTGEVMATVEAVVPIVQTLVRVAGAAGAPAEGLRFIGVGFEHTTWTAPNVEGFSDAQNAVTRHRFSRNGTERGARTWRYATYPNFAEFIDDGAVTLNYAHDVEFTGCDFSHLGYIGLLLRRGCARVRITGNRFDDISSTALQVGDEYDRTDPATYYPPSTAAILRKIEVVDNRITRAGAEYFSATGLAWVYPQDLIVRHNEIGDLPYSGIHGGWGWAWIGGTDRAVTGGLTNERRPLTKRVRVESNFIHDVSRQLVDSGLIYLIGETSGDHPGDMNVISDNYLLRGFNTYGAIYPDEGSSYYRLEHNVIETAPRWLNIWKNSIHDIVSDSNYTNVGVIANHGVRTPVKNTGIFYGSARGPAAEAIIAQAGLEPAFRSLRRDPLIPSAGGESDSGGWTNLNHLWDGSLTSTPAVLAMADGWVEFRLRGEYSDLAFRFRPAAAPAFAGTEWKVQGRDHEAATWHDLTAFRPVTTGGWQTGEPPASLTATELRLCLRNRQPGGRVAVQEFEAQGIRTRQLLDLDALHTGHSEWSHVERLWDYSTLTAPARSVQSSGWVDFTASQPQDDLLFRFRGVDATDYQGTEWKVQRPSAANAGWEDLLPWQTVPGDDWQECAPAPFVSANRFRLCVRNERAGGAAGALEFQIIGRERTP